MTASFPSRRRRGLTRPQSAPSPIGSEARQLDTPTAAARSGDEAPLLYTAEQAAALLQVRPSWLRRKAAARTIPCRYLGKHLRFSRADITAIAEASATTPHSPRRRIT